MKKLAPLLIIVACIAVVMIIVAVFISASKEKGTPSETTTPSSPVHTPPVAQPTEESTSDGVDQTTVVFRDYTLDDIQKMLDEIGIVSVVDNSGYERSKFGSGWLDTDNNSCDTRNDILQRDLTDFVLDSDGCTVLSGILHDKYTGTDINFKRGRSTSSAVQIDHLVPLSRSWALGSSGWDEQQRKRFANDPDNLFAVEGGANNNKSDQGIDVWTPAIYSCISHNKENGLSNSDAKYYCLGVDVYNGSYYDDFDCAYSAQYVFVTHKYNLAMTDSDRTRINSALSTCS